MTSWTDEAAEPHLFIPLTRETVELLATRPDALISIEKVASMKQWVEDVLREYVRDARAAGYGWDAIAKALGVTRQAAWQRYRSEEEEQRHSVAAAGGFLRADDVWSILVRRMRKARWYDLQELYDLVSANATITDADLEPDAPGSNSPRWQRNVRNVLQRRKAVGDIEWDGRARYRLE
jgi:hypothetical protein